MQSVAVVEDELVDWEGPDWVFPEHLRVAPPADPFEPPPADPVDALVTELRLIDRAAARALRLLADAGGLVREGLPARRLVGLLALQTGAEIGFLTRAVQVLNAMPQLWRAFDDGWVSWSQVRGVIVRARPLSVAQLGALDEALVGEVGRQGAGLGEPDRLVEVAGDLVFKLEGAKAEAAEDRGMDANSFVAQATFDGRLDIFTGLDAEGGSAVLEAAALAADRPVGDEPVVDDAGREVPRSWQVGTRRGAQLAEGLVRVARAFLAGQGGVGEVEQARPHVIAVADVGDLSALDVPARGARVDSAPVAAAGQDHDSPCGSVTARILARVADGRLRISRLTAQRLACDARFMIMLSDGEAPVAIGDAQAAISDRLRRAVMARDQGCRMPGCHAAVQWTDAHHVLPREDGGPTCVENLVAVCRPCHSRIHARGWKLTLDPDGTLHIRHGRYQLMTYPRLRAPTLRAGP